jgi:hypothetical protein
VASLQQLARKAQTGDPSAGLDFLKAMAGDRSELTRSLRSEPEFASATTRDIVVRRPPKYKPLSEVKEKPKGKTKQAAKARRKQRKKKR